MSVIVWLPHRDAGWQLPAAEPYDYGWLEGGRRTMHELAVAVAALGRDVEFRGEMSLPVLEPICEAAGARPELPAEPRAPAASDVVIVNEGVENLLVYSRLALSPARTVLMLLAPLGLFGWDFTAGAWSPQDFETVDPGAFGRPEHFRGAAALGFELWTHSPGLQRASEAAGVPCRFIGSGQPNHFPDPPAEKDIDVLTLTNNRWGRLASGVAGQLEARGIRCVEVPKVGHAETLGYFGRARVLVHPSRIEGNSRISYEARAMGCVPVALDTNPYAVGFDEQSGGVAVGSVAEMAEAAGELLAEPARLERLSAAGIEAGRGQVRWGPYLERIGAALDEAPERDPGRDARAEIGRALREREDAADAELALHKQWLEEVNGSASWRLTGPLRSAKRRLSPPR
jgi:glycosyltransferase involved in cell wall biosynthesis